MLDDKNHIWNSVELFQEYTGCALTRSYVVHKLVFVLGNQFGEELLVLSSPGYANIIACKNKADAVVLKMVKDDEEDDIVGSISKVAKLIVKECKTITCDKSTYNMHIDKHIAAESDKTRQKVQR